MMNLLLTIQLTIDAIPLPLNEWVSNSHSSAKNKNKERERERKKEIKREVVLINGRKKNIYTYKRRKTTCGDAHKNVNIKKNLFG